MPGFEIPMRTPTSVLFFFAAAIAAYYALDRPSLVWFAYSSACFFAALGPVGWIEAALYDFPLRRLSQENNRLQEHRSAYILTRVSVVAQTCLFLVGLALGYQGLDRLAFLPPS